MDQDSSVLGIGYGLFGVKPNEMDTSLMLSSLDLRCTTTGSLLWSLRDTPTTRGMERPLFTF
jgi:hypothetical protein